MSSILAHRDDGSGPPILLLNGGLMSIAAWDPFLPFFGDRFRIVRCDFRGQLLSPGEPHSDMVGHADDVVAVLDELGIDRIHVIGPSYGGAVALMLAARYPERVHSLVIATATDRLTEAMLADSQKLQAASRAAASGGDRLKVYQLFAPNTFSEKWLATQPPDLLEQRARQIALLPDAFFSGLADIMAALDTLDLENELPRIKAPTLVIGAELDKVFPVEHSKALAQAIEGARLTILPDVGHAAIVENPPAFFGPMVSFIAEQSGATSDQGPGDA